MRRPDPAAPLPVEAELVGEKASALGRAGRKLKAALAALAAADAAPAPDDPDAKAAAAARRRVLRDEAARQLWYVVVQREAMGLRNHDELMRLYRIPPGLRIYAGPQRRR